jgi:methyl-accepting chemotaxis protein
MRRLAGRDMAVEIVGLGRKDEMADAVAVFKNSTIEADRLAAEQAAGNEAKMQRMRQLEALTQSFEATAAN